ncbi:uroporphyrin-III C-methyltransferase [Kalmusia sp. IMI 367209]|nr:uroporphyrin-III C-methyltransferase [Kalmusia sp. IMI 367209]
MAPPLLTAVDASSHVHLIVGSNPLAAARCTRSLEVGARPILIAPIAAVQHDTLVKRVEEGEITCLDRSFQEDDITTYGRPDVDRVVDAVFVTEGGSVSGTKTIPRQSSPPPARRPRQEDDADAIDTRASPPDLPQLLHAEEEDVEQPATFNTFVAADDSAETAKGHRIRWFSQVCEYWPLDRLATMSDAEIENLLREFHDSRPRPNTVVGMHKPKTKCGKIALIGAGPGHPDLLTRAAYHAILSADVVLADKLIPKSVLDLVPRRATLHIAKKFPGIAERAQRELYDLGNQYLQEGKVVVRLKQGDPYVFGRGGEEYEYYRDMGYTPTVIPGITSALCAPLLAAMPVTYRGVADEVLICTGRISNGAPDPPQYVHERTVVFLMALNRLPDLVRSLGLKNYPENLPCAVLERASCPDQRVIKSSLRYICAAIKEVGSRPPGLFVVGNICDILHGQVGAPWTVEEGFRGLDDVVVPKDRLPSFGDADYQPILNDSPVTSDDRPRPLDL